MSKGEALLRAGLSEAEANRVVVLLASMGIEAVLDRDAYGALGVYVSRADVEEAKRLLSEEMPLERDPAGLTADATGSHGRDARQSTFGEAELAAPEAWFGRGAVAVLALMAACVAMFVLASRGADAGSRSRMLELGAIDYARVNAGEHWRFLTAIFLHFDIGHLFSNLSVMLIVGPPLAHQIGPWRFVLVFLATGVGANVISHFITPAVGLKAGASGAIAGVLGALGGLSLRPGRQTRRRTWQTLGALAAIYGFLIGFGPGRDNVAHVAGLLAGLVLGRMVEPMRPPRDVARALRDQPRSS